MAYQHSQLRPILGVYAFTERIGSHRGKWELMFPEGVTSLITFNPHKNPEKLVLFSPFTRFLKTEAQKSSVACLGSRYLEIGVLELKSINFLTQKPVFHPQHQFIRITWAWPPKT